MSKSATVTVGAAPVLLYEAQGPQAETIMLDVQAGATITLGGPTVTSGAGPQLPVSSVPFTIGPVNGDQIWAVCAAGQTATVAVLTWVSGTGI